MDSNDVNAKLDQFENEAYWASYPDVKPMPSWEERMRRSQAMASAIATAEALGGVVKKVRRADG